MSKTLNLQQISNAAKNLNVPVAALRAVIEVEARGKGFYDNGQPVILFERHVFWQRLTQRNLISLRDQANKERPDLCFPRWTTGSYGSFSAQHKRLEDAAAYHREVALESCSWGLGQVMGYHWKLLGYPTLQSFINAMFRDEAGQLDAMCRFIKVKRLDNYMRALDWAGFALGYNGSGYRANRYDEKLAAAYRKYLQSNDSVADKNTSTTNTATATPAKSTSTTTSSNTAKPSTSTATAKPTTSTATATAKPTTSTAKTTTATATTANAITSSSTSKATATAKATSTTSSNKTTTATAKATSSSKTTTATAKATTAKATTTKSTTKK